MTFYNPRFQNLSLSQLKYSRQPLSMASIIRNEGNKHAAKRVFTCCVHLTKGECDRFRNGKQVRCNGPGIHVANLYSRIHVLSERVRIRWSFWICNNRLVSSTRMRDRSIFFQSLCAPRFSRIVYRRAYRVTLEASTERWILNKRERVSRNVAENYVWQGYTGYGCENCESICGGTWKCSNGGIFMRILFIERSV